MCNFPLKCTISYSKFSFPFPLLPMYFQTMNFPPLLQIIAFRKCLAVTRYVCHMLCLYPSGSLLCLLLFPLPKIFYLSSASLQFLLILNPVQNCSFITTLYRTILDWTHNLPFPTFFKSINYILSLFDKYTVPYFVDC